LVPNESAKIDDGSSLSDVRDTHIVEDVARQLAPHALPAVALYEVESLATRWFLIEIEGIAVNATGTWEVRALDRLDDAADIVVATGLHALAVRAGPLIFTSSIAAYHAGTHAVITDASHLPERGRRVVEDAVLSQPYLRRSVSTAQRAAQTWVIYDRLLRIADHFGCKPDQFLKTTVYLRDIAELPVVEAVARTFFAHLALHQRPLTRRGRRPPPA
jgi:enamine deaminase RidA (YjgF/YER057c/UK114 family)